MFTTPVIFPTYPLYRSNFGYSSILKKEFKKGKIPLKRDITGAVLKRGKATLDHTIPKSKGGKSCLANYSLMNGRANFLRGNQPLKDFIDLESLIEYISVMLDVKTPSLDGVKYIKGWLKNLLKEIKENK